MIAGPLSDWLTARMGARGRVWLMIFSLGVSPFISFWLYAAPDVISFYIRFTLYSIILTLWLPPVYSLYYDLVLPRLRPRGLFLAHNVVNKRDEMRDFLSAIRDNPQVLTTIVSPGREGMSVTLKLR